MKDWSQHLGKEGRIDKKNLLFSFGFYPDFYLNAKCNERDNEINLGHTYDSTWEMASPGLLNPHPLGDFTSFHSTKHVPIFRVKDFEVYAVSKLEATDTFTLRPPHIPFLRPGDSLITNPPMAFDLDVDYSNASKDKIFDHASKLHKHVEHLLRITAIWEKHTLLEALAVRRLVPSAKWACMTRKRSRSTDVSENEDDSENEYNDQSDPCEKICNIFSYLKELEKQSNSFIVSDLVHFNVLGTKMSIRRSTIILAVPLCQLARRVDPQWTEQAQDLDEENNILIYEPVECFQALLSYMRIRALRLQLGAPAPTFPSFEDPMNRIFIPSVLYSNMVTLLDYQGIDVIIVTVDSNCTYAHS
jgi:hypothetical protein